ncbi:exodeoxyribonuclease VII large subunit [Myroides sp. LJL119]
MRDLQTKWFTLSVILNRVKDIFDASISGKHFWLKTEVSQIKQDRRGHYYLELVENRQGVTLARSRATIWKGSATVIENKLGDQHKNILKEGAEILCLCEIVFSQVYGFSISILDVDLSFSLGEVERKKQQALLELKNLGMLDLNKKIDVPLVIQNIAILGSVNTAGYTDFIKQLQQNNHGIIFHTKSFDTIVQGDNAHVKIIQELEKIKPGEFHVIVLLRGGGATMDLDVFNNLALAKSIANCKTAVYTAIGHQTDVSVVDFVSNQSFKTPSAVGAYIVERAFIYLNKVQEFYRGIMDQAMQLLYKSKVSLQNNANDLKTLVDHNCQKRFALLQLHTNFVHYSSQSMYEKKKADLNLITQEITQEATLGLRSKKNELKQVVNHLEMNFKTMYQSYNFILKSHLQTLEFYSLNFLNKKSRELEQITDIVQGYDLQKILKKGFALVLVNGKVIHKDVRLMPNDIIELQLYNKAYLITIKDIKQTKIWKDLLMRQQAKN